MILNAPIVRVAIGADRHRRPCRCRAVGQAEIGARLQVFVVKAGLKAGHDRSARVHVVANLLALLIAEHGDIRQQQRAIFAKPLRHRDGLHAQNRKRTAPAAAHRKVPASSRACRRASARRRRSGIEKLRALPHHDANVGDGAASLEVRIVLRGPAKIIRADLLPAAIFAQAIL